jgi:hypothetical protein
MTYTGKIRPVVVEINNLLLIFEVVFLWRSSSFLKFSSVT